MSESNFVRVSAMGPVDLDLTLILSESDCQSFDVPDFKDIQSLKDCQAFLVKTSKQKEVEDINNLPQNSSKSEKESKNICDLIRLSSSNPMINSILFINRAYKQKTFIEYLTLGLLSFAPETEFMKDIVKYVAEQNFLFIIENDVFGQSAKINFTIKLSKGEEGDDENKDDPSKNIKTFTIKTESKSTNDPKEISFYETLNYQFGMCNYFYADLSFIFQMEKNGLELSEFKNFILKLVEVNPHVNLMLNYPDVIAAASNMNIEFVSSINEIVSQTDIFIFDKKEALSLLNLLSQVKNDLDRNNTLSSKNNINDNQQHIPDEKKNLEILFIKEIKKKRKNFPKIGLFFDDLKKLTIIEQQAKTNLVLFHSDFEFNFIPNTNSKSNFNFQAIQTEYKKLLAVYEQELKYIFLGGFLSRLFYKKSFNTSFQAGLESARRILELYRFELDFPLDSNYYLVVVKKSPQEKKKNKEELENGKKEQHFVLDCINVVNSKMKKYNPLHDDNLHSFFTSIHIRKHLKKLGFINKEGQILEDPDTKRLGIVKNKKLVNVYENEHKYLLNIRESNQKMKLQIQNLFQSASTKLQNANQTDLEKMTKVYNFNPVAGKKLPSIRVERSQNIRSLSPPHNDLYAKAIMQNKKEQMLSTVNKGKFAKKNLKPISKDSYLKLLDNYENKKVENNSKEVKPVPTRDNDKAVNKEEIIKEREDANDRERSKEADENENEQMIDQTNKNNEDFISKE